MVRAWRSGSDALSAITCSTATFALHSGGRAGRRKRRVEFETFGRRHDVAASSPRRRRRPDASSHRYLGLPEVCSNRCKAMGVVASAVLHANDAAAALPMLKHHLAYLQKFLPDSKENFLTAVAELANCYTCLSMHDESLTLCRTAYDGSVGFRGAMHKGTIWAGTNLVNALLTKELFAEAKQLARKMYRAARQLGDVRGETTGVAVVLAVAICKPPDASRADLLEGEALLARASKKLQQTLGPDHPETLFVAENLAGVRHNLRGGHFGGH